MYHLGWFLFLLDLITLVKNQRSLIDFLLFFDLSINVHIDRLRILFVVITFICQIIFRLVILILLILYQLNLIIILLLLLIWKMYSLFTYLWASCVALIEFTFRLLLKLNCLLASSNCSVTLIATMGLWHESLANTSIVSTTTWVIKVA